MHGCSGGMHGYSGGGCMVALGGVHGCSRGACMVAPRGACVVAPGGGHAWDTMRYADTVNERAVCILLECILVFFANTILFIFPLALAITIGSRTHFMMISK